MLEKLPLNRLLIYALVAGLLPLFFVIFNFMSKDNTVNELQGLLQLVYDKALSKEKKQAVNMIVKNHFKDADHFYIDKNLETLTFLEPETESLQKITSNKNYPEDENIKKRQDFLSGPGNNMIFSEGVVQTYPFFQETTETLVHPVEINASDLQKILSRIEGIEIGANKPPLNPPQLLVLDFKLDRKKIGDKNEVFILNLKLLKREFL